MLGCLPTISSNRPKDKHRPLPDERGTSLSEVWYKDKVSYQVTYFWGVVPQWKHPLYLNYSHSKRIYTGRQVLPQPVKSVHPIYFYFCASEMFVGIEWPRLTILFPLSSMASFKDEETCVFFQCYPPSTGFYRTATPGPEVHSKRF